MSRGSFLNLGMSQRWRHARSEGPGDPALVEGEIDVLAIHAPKERQRMIKPHGKSPMFDGRIPVSIAWLFAWLPD